MNSWHFERIAQALLPVAFLFGIYLLLRGHNEPGGGFIAGLVTAAALVLLALAFGPARARAKLTPLMRPAFAIGLLLAVGSGLIAWLAGDQFLRFYHAYLPLPGDNRVHVSTTLIFDIGVYLVVVGTVITLIAVFAEATE